MKKISFPFRYFYFFLWIIITIWIYYYYFMDILTDEIINKETFEIVKLWDIKKSISVSWTAKLVDEQSIKFTQVWKIVKVNFNEGDKIMKWQIIAELNKTEWLYKVEDANIALSNSKVKFDQLYEIDESKILNTEKNIESTKNSIISAKKELIQLMISNKNSIDDTKKYIDILKIEYFNTLKSLEDEKKDLELFKLEQEDSLSSSKNDLNNNIKKIEDNITLYFINSENIIEEIDYILWVTENNKQLNDSYNIYLSAKNSTYKSDAKNSFLKVLDLYNSVKEKKDSYSVWDTKNLKILINDFLVLFEELYITTDLTYKVFGSGIENKNFTQSEINSKKSSISSFRSSILSKITTINSNIDSLNNLIDIDLIIASNELALKKKEDAIVSTKLSIEKKKNDLITIANSYISTQKSDDLKVEDNRQSIELLEKTLEIYIMDLEKLKEWPTIENIKLAKNNIKQEEIKVQNAIDDLINYELEAPFNWIVRKIDFQVWDNIDSNSDKYIYIENPDLLEIIIMLDQIDIVNVKVWDKALIKFDAYRNIQVDWKISLIDITPIIQSWVVSFEVKIIITDKTFDKKILSWMTADIEIITEEKNNIILVSTVAIKEKYWNKYVIVDNNWTRNEVEITTGLISWWKTEILTWLNVWYNIITSDFKASSITEETSKKESIVPTPNRWWWNRKFNRN